MKKIAIHDKTTNENYIIMRNDMIAELTNEYRKLHPEYSGWQIAARIENDLKVAAEKNNIPKMNCGVFTIRNVMRKLGIYN
ncbi:MAG: hypothetical protein II956_13390 [Bacteroidales bacterium]|nr:hypothetical protein [Bacteroidales bacterium]